MLGWLADGIAEHRWGDWASVIGLLLTLVGFAITIPVTLSAKKAVKRFQTKLLTIDVVAELSAALTQMAALKEAHRDGQWERVLGHYDLVRRGLVAAREAGTALAAFELGCVQTAIDHLSVIGRRVERHLAGERDAPSPAAVNSTLSSQMDLLFALLVQLKLRSGDEHGH